MPQPFYKHSRNTWYLEVDGKQHNLGPDREEAFALYHELMVAHGQGKLGRNPKASQLVLAYLSWAKNPKHMKSTTYEWYKYHLDLFLAHRSAKVKLRDFTISEVEDWLDDDYGHVGVTTRGHGIRCIKRVFNWAEKRKKIGDNPLRHLERPTIRSRQGKTMSDEQWEAFYTDVAEADDQPFLALITVLRLTGCRITEFKQIQAKWFDRKARFWVFPDADDDDAHECSKKLLGRRVPLDDVSFAISEQAANLHPDGRMFQPKKSFEWKNSNVNRRCKRFSDRLGFRIYPYMLRHTFATNALERGVNVLVLKDLMGHKDLTMLSQVYAHVEEKKKLLADSQNKVIEGDIALRKLPKVS